MNINERKRVARLHFGPDSILGDGTVVETSLSVRIEPALEVQMALLSLSESATGEKQRDIFRLFGDEILESWNLEDDEGPIPATGEGILQRLPLDMAWEIVNAWADALGGRSGNSDSASPNGVTAEALAGVV